MTTSSTSLGWFVLRGTRGYTICADSYVPHPSGTRYLSLYPSYGDQPVIHLRREQWADPQHGQAWMVRLWATAAAGDGSYDDTYGHEFAFTLPGGAVRCALDGSHLRVVDKDGVELEGAYWSCQEWQDDPAGVLGAALGAAATISGSDDSRP